ncbi:MAG: hypothetical protein AABX51_09230 [Nanoarchaeota archaeon]
MNPAKILNFGLKLLVPVLGSVVFLFPDVIYLKLRGMEIKFFIFSLASLIFPIIWTIYAKRKQYPHIIDAMITLPLVIDLAGNALGYYYYYWTWFDNITHFINPVIYGIVLYYLLSLIDQNKIVVWLAVIGIMAFGHVAWELFEYVTPFADKTIMNLSYEDTLSDLFMGVVGQFVVSIFIFFDPLKFYKREENREKVAN